MIKKQTPSKENRILVAMSGGVDSSVTAAWLAKRGFDVTGVFLQVNAEPAPGDKHFGYCQSLKNIEDAEKVAKQMGFPFHVYHVEKDFSGYIVDYFLKEYMNGRTPNPCVLCNATIKFKKLLEVATQLKADYLATGHYATVQYNSETDLYELAKARDLSKDQTYFLSRLEQKDLKKLYFPMGEYEKAEVREIAKKLELPVAEKKESQENCFIQDQNYKEFFEERVPSSLFTPGRIIDLTGKELGKHSGLHQFTIGQRKGLGVNSQEPLFVVHIIKDAHEVVVGPEKALYRSKCTVSDLNWILPPELDKTTAFNVKIRYRSQEAAVEVKPLLDNRLEVHFETPQKSITPGQAAVFYQDDLCMGGGWIEDYPKE